MISLFGKNEPEPTLLEKLKASVTKTKAVLSETVDNIFQGEKKIDASLLKQLETALLSADLGVRTTKEILESVREKLERNALSDGNQVKREIKSHITRILNASAANVPSTAGPLAGPASAAADFHQRPRAARDFRGRRERRRQNDQHRQARQSPAQR